jgi:FkbH-like protein
MENIKLIIWDLDDTFWRGTLSDGAVTPVPENIAFINTLLDRGIVHSICSKNDYEKTKAELEKLGVWDLFVFPSIDWTNKGERVRQIIENMQLRAINCLFVDDNVNNLREAEYACEGLQTVTPDKLPELVSTPAFEGKDDTARERLNQYKILEQKASAKSESGSNEDFLYQSEIKVEMIEDCGDKLKRIHEMIHRNNQLNFTKDRISRDEVEALFTDKSVKSGVVHVSDKYGDHGIIGCYAVRDGKAIQFVFSCRIMGMGVEQYVYAELGFPRTEVIGEVAGELIQGEKPGWINQSGNIAESGGKVNIPSLPKHTRGRGDLPKILVRGSCEIVGIVGYLETRLTASNVTFQGTFEITSLSNVRGILEFSDEQKEYLLRTMPTLVETSYSDEIFSGKYEYVMIGVVWERLMVKVVNKADPNFYIYLKSEEFVSSAVGEEVFDEWEVLPYDDSAVEDSLQFICDNLPHNVTLLVMTCSELIFPEKGKDEDWKRRCSLNSICERIAERNENVRLIDTRVYVKNKNDIQSDEFVHHLQRTAQFNIADDVLRVMGLIPRETGNDIPANIKVCEEILSESGLKPDNLSFKVYIINGVFNMVLNLDRTCDFEYKFTLKIGIIIEFDGEWTGDTNFQYNLPKFGDWRLTVSIRKASGTDTEELYKFITRTLEYGIVGLTHTIDAKAVDDYASKVLPIHIEQYNHHVNLWNRHTKMIAMLMGAGWKLSKILEEYFTKKNITKLKVLANRGTSPLIYEALAHSALKINSAVNIFGDGFNVPMCGGFKIFKVTEYKDGAIADGDNVLIAYHGDILTNRVVKKIEKKVRYYYLTDILIEYITQKIYLGEILNWISGKANVPVLFLQLPHTRRLILTPDENEISRLNAIRILALIEQGNPPASWVGCSSEKFNEVIKLDKERFINRVGKVFPNRSGKWLNVENGFRKTTGQPKQYHGTIWMFGNQMIFGQGVADDETIASHLQVMVASRYRVINASNFKNCDYSNILTLNALPIKRNDVIIVNVMIAFRPYEHVKLLFEFADIPEIYHKVDALLAFKTNMARKNMFLLPDLLSSNGNKYVAELLRDKLTALGLLSDQNLI